jgi:hypothetical protein
MRNLLSLRLNLLFTIKEEVIVRYAIQKHISYRESQDKLCRIVAIAEFIKSYDRINVQRGDLP